MNNQPKEPAEIIGFFIGKITASALMAFLITNYQLPMWLAFILIFLV